MLRAGSKMRLSHALVPMHQRRAGLAGGLGIEDGGKHLVIDDDPPAALLGGSDRLRDHGGDALAHMAHHIVEDAGVVHVVGGGLMPGEE